MSFLYKKDIDIAITSIINTIDDKYNELLIQRLAGLFNTLMCLYNTEIPYNEDIESISYLKQVINTFDYWIYTLESFFFTILDINKIYCRYELFKCIIDICDQIYINDICKYIKDHTDLSLFQLFVSDKRLNIVWKNVDIDIYNHFIHSYDIHGFTSKFVQLIDLLCNISRTNYKVFSINKIINSIIGKSLIGHFRIQDRNRIFNYIFPEYTPWFAFICNKKKILPIEILELIWNFLTKVQCNITMNKKPLLLECY